jgi:hypothetical protein
MLKRKIQWLLWKLGKMLEAKDPKKRPRLHKQAVVVTGNDAKTTEKK